MATPMPWADEDGECLREEARRSRTRDVDSEKCEESEIAHRGLEVCLEFQAALQATLITCLLVGLFVCGQSSVASRTSVPFNVAT